MTTASYSTFTGAYTAGNAKGKNAVGVLAIGQNEPKGQETIAAKIGKTFVESYMRRPSLKDEAYQKMTEFAHNELAALQTPAYPASCHLAMLTTQGNQFRWQTLGDVRIYHFVNGQIMRSNEGIGIPLGEKGEKKRPDGIEATDFSQGENSFLLCSGSLARALRESEMENALSLSDNAEEWMNRLRALYEDRASEPVAILTAFIPAKRKRLPKKTVIAIIIALVVLAVGAFFALGAARRRGGPEGGPGGPGQRPPRQDQNAPMPPAEPTEPPAPEGGGDRGEKPTRPPQPTRPPEPTNGQ